LIYFLWELLLILHFLLAKIQFFLNFCFITVRPYIRFLSYQILLIIILALPSLVIIYQFFLLNFHVSLLLHLFFNAQIMQWLNFNVIFIFPELTFLFDPIMLYLLYLIIVAQQFSVISSFDYHQPRFVIMQCFKLNCLYHSFTVAKLWNYHSD